MDRNDIQGKLLILGEPGAGKTTELLSLNQDLITRAIENKNAPIPIIFELSNWKNDQPIRDWLIEELSQIYQGIPKEVGEHWIDNQQLIPLLDGLDELGLERQNKCIIALNEFLASTFQPGLVVCCRREEYEQAQTKLDQLNGAIYLQPLSNKQIQQYLKSINRSRIWNNTIIKKRSLLELIRKPLFLTMLVVADPERPIRNASELFKAYIEKQLPDSQGTYPPRKSPIQERTFQKRTLHYLVWLAKKLEDKNETVFLIEGIQPNWLATQQQWEYHLIFGLIVGVVGGLIVCVVFSLIFSPSTGIIGGLIFGLSAGLIFGLNRGLVTKLDVYLNIGRDATFYSFKQGLIFGLMGGLVFGLSAGLMFWLFFGLNIGLIFGLVFGLVCGLGIQLNVGLRGGLSEIQPVEAIQIPISREEILQLFYLLEQSLIFGLVGGLIFGLVGGLIVELIFGLTEGLIFGLIGGLIFGLVGGLIFGLVGGLKTSIKIREKPNQGIKNSLQNMLKITLVAIIISVMGFPFKLGIEKAVNIIHTLEPTQLSALVAGLLFSLVWFSLEAGGGQALLAHIALRIVMILHGYAPYRYDRFLRHAAKHRFIQGVSGRYRFMHDLLQKHFAQMS